MNSFGKLLTLTSFGESHGPAMGGVLDGMPAGVAIDLEKLQRFVDRRRPGQPLATPRDEKDCVEILSGIYQGKTLGTPIGFVVRNEDRRSEDYASLADVFRPSHADYTYEGKYGLRDPRGGGRASARETLTRVVAGALAMQVLEPMGIEIHAKATRVGDATEEQDFSQAIALAHEQGDTLGAEVSCVITGVPAGLGEPVFGKLHARLAMAMMSINAAKGFDYGLGFGFATARGSEVTDRFVMKDGRIGTETNYSGGIQGGISNGEDICFRVAFRPVPTLPRGMEAMRRGGEPVELRPGGRHDVCVVPRVIPVVEAMAALVILDNCLLNAKNDKGMFSNLLSGGR